MATTFSESFRARWVDMDFNQHMRNAAFLGCAEDTRMRYLASSGWPMAEFQRLQIGPVVVEDKLTYRRELRLLEAFRVDLRVAAMTQDVRKLRMHSRIIRESDNELCGTVETVALWFDIAKRRPIAPPETLRDLWLSLERTEDFAWYPEREPKP